MLKILLFNPVLISSGSATNCGLAFQNDLITGLYSNSLDTLEISTWGSQRISIKNSRTFINQQIQGTTASSAGPSYSFGGTSTRGTHSGGGSI